MAATQKTTARTVRRALAAATLGAVLAASPAQAQGFFETLFGGGIKRQQRGDFPPPPPQGRPSQGKPQQAAKPVTKISAPSYYTYKADPLVPVAIPRPRRDETTATLVLAGARFDEAMAGLESIDLRAEKEVAEAIAKHYAAHPGFVWVSGFGPNGRAVQALRILGEADGHGLDAADYGVEVPDAGFAMDRLDERQAELARFELALSARVLRYVRDAARGRVDPNRLSGYHDFAPKALDLAGALDNLSRTQDVAVYLDSFHPQGPEYQALRVELETLRAQAENDIVVDPRLLLKPGATSPELPKIVALIEQKSAPDFVTRNAVAIALARGKETYSQDMVPLIKAAQEAHGLKGDGVIGPRTVQVLAGVSKAERLTKVLVALEQLRWHPSELGARRVFINQPAFTATYFENGVEALSMRTVIGKVSNQTSFFHDEIETIDYNPYWGVPQSIIVNEMLPKLRQDPGYLDRAGYEVTDAKGRHIPSSSIDWWSMGSKVPYNVRQTPSEANALGELKIMFPNKHAIYMHDTPQKALFDRDSRAFSHGCVRLSKPREMAAAVMGRDVGYIRDRLAKGHSTDKVPGRIPVYVAYFTAWPNAQGTVEYFADVYDRDARVMTAIERTEEVRAPSV